MESSGAVVSAALSPVLAAFGFAAGQYGEGVESQTIFCAPFDDFADRFPELDQARGQERGVGACVDLTVEVGREGTICGVELEARPLDETLRLAGLGAEADQLASVTISSLEQQLDLLSIVLPKLFTRPS